MTTPNDATSEPPIDIADPRWVDDVLARARRRAEEARRNDNGVARTEAPSGTSASPADVAEPTANGTPPPARTFEPARVVEPTFAPTADAPTLPPIEPTFAPAADAPTRRPIEPAFAPVDEPPARRPIEPAFDPVSEPPPRRPIELTSIDGAPPAPARGAPAGVEARSRAERRREPVVEVTPTLDDDEPGAPLLLAPADAGTDDEPPARALRTWLEWGMVIAGALLVAFLIRTVAFQAFYIPSESMEHTLEVRDRILVNKLSYKLHDVNRGDIIVFEKPPGETSKINDLIKRVIALPGETIEQQGRDLYIDRGEGPQKLTESYVNDPNDTGPSIAWVQGCVNPSSEITRCTIPEGHVWVMGDNRAHSHDSRVFGPIDQDLIVGRAFVKVWPFTKLGFL